jgi:hypothetical protein
MLTEVWCSKFLETLLFEGRADDGEDKVKLDCRDTERNGNEGNEHAIVYCLQTATMKLWMRRQKFRSFLCSYAEIDAFPSQHTVFSFSIIL